MQDKVARLGHIEQLSSVLGGMENAWVCFLNFFYIVMDARYPLCHVRALLYGALHFIEQYYNLDFLKECGVNLIFAVLCSGRIVQEGKRLNSQRWWWRGVFPCLPTRGVW